MTDERLERIQSIYQAARAAEPSQRDAYLADVGFYAAIGIEHNPFLANRRGYPHLVSDSARFAAALG